MEKQILDCHDTHCCIDSSHGCKYGDPDCPVAKGIRKQQGFCEDCGLETEGYFGEPELTVKEQEEYLEQLWLRKNDPDKPVKPNSDLYGMSKKELRHEIIRLRELLKKG